MFFKGILSTLISFAILLPRIMEDFVNARMSVISILFMGIGALCLTEAFIELRTKKQAVAGEP